MTDPAPPAWERAVLEKLALRALDEQRHARHWSTLIRLAWVVFAFLALAIAMGWIGRIDGDKITAGKHTALVELKGVIGVEARASADKVITALNLAFKDINQRKRIEADFDGL